MSGLLQKADLTMLEEQIQKMQNAYEYAEKTTQIIKKVQKKLRGQDGRRAVQIKNALHEQDERSQELSSDLKNLKDGLVWVENLMYYADQEAARQLGAENDGSWDMKRKAFEEARARLPNEDPVILILNGDESAHDDTTPGETMARRTSAIPDGSQTECASMKTPATITKAMTTAIFPCSTALIRISAALSREISTTRQTVNFVYPSRKWSCIKSRPAKRRIPHRHGDPMERNTQQTIPGLLKTWLSIKISLRFFVKSSIRLSIITIRLWPECKATLLQ